MRNSLRVLLAHAALSGVAEALASKSIHVIKQSPPPEINHSLFWGQRKEKAQWKRERAGRSS